MLYFLKFSDLDCEKNVCCEYWKYSEIWLLLHAINPYGPIKLLFKLVNLKKCEPNKFLDAYIFIY